MSSTRKSSRRNAAPTATADPPPVEPVSLLSDDDLHLFNEGTHYRLYEKLGARPMTVGGAAGTAFAVWAPNARRVSVVGDFNGWTGGRHELAPQGRSGIWAGFVPQVAEGAVYKYQIESRERGHRVEKADPFGFRHEVPPRTASVVDRLDHDWGDAEWMSGRGPRQALDRPLSIYELHVGSWMHHEQGRPLTYRELAPRLARHVRETGFTHVELLPVMEHPFAGSWGYQTTGYFAPTSRFGGPRDFMAMIDHLHQEGIGVILDWVPSHFPTDEHGLAYFDGTHLYEHADPRQGFHPDWKSYIFNYGRDEVRSFLISSALFWLDKYHVDGLRVDAVASMLYLDYSRAAGEWIPNKHGGRENLAAIEFLRQLNKAVYEAFPDVQTIAEESTAWPMVSRPTYVGGLGFGYKWDMGWMHDTLKHISRDPIHRKYHYNELTFRAMYQFTENYVLPLSHDEVVHGKGSLLGKMPGDDWRKFANLRLLLADQWLQPGKKLLFMGAEIAQWAEWNHDGTLDWALLGHGPHDGVRRLVSELNRLYRGEPALHRLDCEPGGFQWIEANDSDNNVVAFMRHGPAPADTLICVLNFAPVPRNNYLLGAPAGGYWRELLNTDAESFGGSGQGNLGGVQAAPVGRHGQPRALNLTLPPLAALVLKADPTGPDKGDKNEGKGKESAPR